LALIALGAKILRKLVEHSWRRSAKPACISLAMDRAKALAAGSAGQNRAVPALSAS
jgi:hypothetical protein